MKTRSALLLFGLAACGGASALPVTPAAPGAPPAAPLPTPSPPALQVPSPSPSPIPSAAASVTGPALPPPRPTTIPLSSGADSGDDRSVAAGDRAFEDGNLDTATKDYQAALGALPSKIAASVGLARVRIARTGLPLDYASGKGNAEVAAAVRDLRKLAQTAGAILGVETTHVAILDYVLKKTTEPYPSSFVS